ncbi:MAG: CHASE2 domain-containing protein [Alphaproteobacteria bacterium]|nr:CHASE2 domain-containing protein [Alphaproteobacteria bacterium]
MRWLRRIALLAALGLGTVFVTVGAGRLLPVVAFAENWVADLRVAWLRPPPAQRGDIIVLGIDETTLAGMPYRSPIDRGQLGEWIVALEAGGVRAIGIDVLFDQPTEPAKDARLKAWLDRARVPIVVAWAEVPDGLTPHQTAFQGEFLTDLRSDYVGLRVDPAGIARDLTKAVALFRAAADVGSPGRRMTWALPTSAVSA